MLILLRTIVWEDVRKGLSNIKKLESELLEKLLCAYIKFLFFTKTDIMYIAGFVQITQNFLFSYCFIFIQ